MLFRLQQNLQPLGALLLIASFLLPLAGIAARQQPPPERGAGA